MADAVSLREEAKALRITQSKYLLWREKFFHMGRKGNIKGYIQFHEGGVRGIIIVNSCEVCWSKLFTFSLSLSLSLSL